MNNSYSNSVYFVSLGCPKNLVDSQVMLGLLKSKQFNIVEEAEKAETIIVNTCSFIEKAKQESIDTVLEMAQYKEKGNLQNLILSGCLAQRYSKDLEKELPEVDIFIGTGEYHRVASLLQEKKLNKLRKKSYVNTPEFIHTEETPRLHTGMAHSAFLKISEGCVRNCSFCIIPALRGNKVRSRTADSLTREAEKLASQGVKELCLVAQDLTHYGIETDYKENLAKLLKALVGVSGIEWIRLHYAYPDNFPPEIIELIQKEEKILNYIDMPLQHIDSKVLKLMNRRITASQVYTLIDKLKKSIPGLVLRTNIIVGHPGETEKAYKNMKKSLEEICFDNLGVFTYSLEENTASYRLTKKIGEIPKEIAQERYNEIMELQQNISSKKNKAYIGKTLSVMVDGLSSETDLLLQGRFYGQAADIDGVVLINEGEAKPGDIVKVKITDSMPYDLVGNISS